ncbi:MAG TPA: branched-chain amino acid ABC transporter substrate-binding protein [Acetobacteraceae bacterium]|jgi:branched-chain amino acid transport system substrate-binding protein|nr:branched-chain amino acid ABC transporter substrate-binding protein [Acetobacteraceae bacterium]
MLTRRATAQLLATTAIAAALGSGTANAADKVVKIGIDLSLTGADSLGANRVKNAIVMAFEAANQGNAVQGYRFDLLTLDDGTATAGQYDPAQAATNARKMVADKEVVASIGPQMSGAGKAMTPILSQGGLATITPSSTNPDITNPKFADQYRPAGKPIYFRTVTTDAFQGPNMANFLAEKLKVKSVYILDDSGAFGVGIADTFQKEAETKGVKVLGRDRLDPKAADYTAILTKIKSMNPEALYYGGVTQAGVKLAKQAYDIIPNVIKAGPDGMYSSDLLNGAGFPAVEGWYTSIAAPHLVEDNKAAQFIQAYKGRFNDSPDDYTITAYDASLVIIDSIKRVVAAGKPVTRETVRDAIQAAKVPTIQGVISFDANGDLADRTVSVFQIKKDTAKSLTDVSAQYKYIDVAPQS